MSPEKPATRHLARKTLAALAVRTTPQNRLAGPAMHPAASRIRSRLPPRNINGAFALRNPLIYRLLMKTKSRRPSGHDGFCRGISVKFVRINKALPGKPACCRRLLMFLSGCFFATLHPLSATSTETAISTGPRPSSRQKRKTADETAIRTAKHIRDTGRRTETIPGQAFSFSRLSRRIDSYFHMMYNMPVRHRFPAATVRFSRRWPGAFPILFSDETEQTPCGKPMPLPRPFSRP